VVSEGQRVHFGGTGGFSTYPVLSTGEKLKSVNAGPRGECVQGRPGEIMVVKAGLEWASKDYIGTTGLLNRRREGNSLLVE